MQSDVLARKCIVADIKILDLMFKINDATVVSHWRIQAHPFKNSKQKLSMNKFIFPKVAFVELKL